MLLNIFKSKPTLKELIPKGFVDIHSHILPAIDDGAKNVEESAMLISEMKNLGFGKIIATPHTFANLYENTNDSIKSSFQLLSKLKVDLKIDYASEYLIDSSLIKRISEKTILTLKENHILLEMSYLAPANNLHEIIHFALINNYIPVIAHPERYIFYHKNFKEYEMLKRIGCKFQLNLLSVTGHYGKSVLKISKKLIRKNLIDFVGSDIHNLNQCKSFEKKVLVEEFNKLENIINNNSFFD